MNVKLKTVVSAALLTKSASSLADTYDRTSTANTSVANTSELATDEQWMVDVDTSYTQRASSEK
ncbi:MAG: hypothetical protein DRR19_07035 [Candidatus Parabeggiatoa sp. nov. 1]|nr:MAG: hypothetical protein DRR19_07035 [Gammaproteobacteria bacterium]